MATKAILFFFGCSEVNSTWLITSELANQSARKILFTCVVYTKVYYYYYYYYYYFILSVAYILLFNNDWKFSKQKRPYKTISDLTDKDFLPVNRRRLQLTCFPCILTFNNNSDLRMSSSPAYPPWRRLLLPTRAFQLLVTNHTWAFARYQTNNRTVATRRTLLSWNQ